MIIVKYCPVCGQTFKDMSKNLCDITETEVSKVLVSKDKYKEVRENYKPKLLMVTMTVVDGVLDV